MTIAELADRFWTLRMAEEPTWANLLGDHRFDDRLEDPSLEAEDRFITDVRAVIAEAESIDPAGLTEQDRITRELLISEAEGALVNPEGRVAEFLVDPQIGAHVLLLTYAPQMTAPEPAHAEALIERYRRVGGMFDALAGRHRQGVAHGRTPVRTLVEKSLDQLDRYLASDVGDDPWLKPAAPARFDDAAEEKWRERLREQVVETIRPAYDRYREVLRDEILPATRSDDRCGLGWLPDGAPLYRRAIAKYTSLQLPAEEIHQIGLDTMAALEDEYRKIGGRALGTIDRGEIFTRLRDDPGLRFEVSGDVIAAAEEAIRRAQASAPTWFGTMPAGRCRVMAIPELDAEEAPLAYYIPPAEDGSRPGTFFINAAHPERLTRYESEALAFHEAVPGHHFQLALAQEDRTLPAFRRNGLLYAYVEGWGLYTERLADEMGLYSGDLERMGMLSFDSWRAGRLVVDTGIHALGWTRSQAIDYLTANTPQQLHNITTEVDRYIGYFGQALSYMMGRREIMQLRSEARSALGDRFDIKAFHDTVLGSGPVTLPILRRLVNDWVATR